MPSWAIDRVVVERERSDTSSSERFARALAMLTREVWHPECTFASAIGAICRTACRALEVERVSIWEYQPDQKQLCCLHVCQARDSGPLDAASLDTLSLDGDDYMAALEGVRALDNHDFDSVTQGPASHLALRDYLKKHNINALLDAPALVGGEILGVISHESVDRRRTWTAAEIAFAASMGDYVAMAYEIARRRTAEDTVQHLLLHDRSTGLPNREYVEELLKQRLVASRRSGEMVAVVHARIDAAGGGVLAAGAPSEEDVMAMIASRLRDLERHQVDLARVHSNGFVFVLVSRGAEGAAVRLAERCLTRVRQLGEQEGGVHPGAAIGVAFANDAFDLEPRDLLRRAEEAADSALRIDKFAYAVFDIERHEALVEQLRTERAMRAAFANDEFELHYQPEYDAAEHRWVAAEALLRWQHDGRLRSAAEFVGAAEVSGLIVPLGSWVLRRACRDAAHWPATPDGAIVGLRVNVSARQFEAAGLAEDVATALADSGVDPGRLCLEITETTLMENIEHALSVLVQLKQLGVKIAIDDFGTGYASLTYLKQLPVDVLKIDRSFVMGLPADRVDAAIVSAVAGLADSLGIDVVAEGVETVEQQHALQAVGVRRMQGWLYAKAMDQSRVCQLLSAVPPDAPLAGPEAVAG